MIQFHATPAELAALAKQWASSFSLHVARTRFPPYEVAEIKSSEIETAIADQKTDELVFSTKPYLLPALNQIDFFDRNPETLMLDIGHLTGGYLHESALGNNRAASESLGTWKEIARQLKKATKAGVVVLNPRTGEQAKEKTHRYTPGAKQLEAEGVTMLTIAGIKGPILRFGAE